MLITADWVVGLPVVLKFELIVVTTARRLSSLNRTRHSLLARTYDFARPRLRKPGWTCGVSSWFSATTDSS